MGIVNSELRQENPSRFAGSSDIPVLIWENSQRAGQHRYESRSLGIETVPAGGVLLPTLLPLRTSPHYLSYSPEPTAFLHRAGRALLDAIVTTATQTLVFAACVTLAYQAGETFGPHVIPAAGIVIFAVALIAWVWRVALRFPDAGKAS